MVSSDQCDCIIAQAVLIMKYDVCVWVCVLRMLGCVTHRSDRAGIVGALTLAKVGYENHSIVRRNRRKVRRRTAMVTLAACIVVPCVCVAVLLYPRAKRA